MTIRRIYLITNRTTSTQHLVRAANPAAAIRHVARATFSAAVAAQETLVDLLTAAQPLVVEDAGSESEAVA